MILTAINELTNKYRLPNVTATEEAISKAFSDALKTNIICNISQEGVMLITFNRLSKPSVLKPSVIKKKMKRQIVYLLETELQKKQAVFEFHSMRDLQGQVVNATITRIADNHTVFGILEINSSTDSSQLLIGECPLRHQPAHERGGYCLGETRKFYISSVRPVAGKRGEGRVRIILSRTTIELPAAMLSDITNISGIRCTRRIAGAFSNIETPKRVPKTAINTVGKELHEHLKVNVRSTEK